MSLPLSPSIHNRHCENTLTPLKLYSLTDLSACLSTKIICARGKLFQSVCLSFSPCLSVSARATTRRTATKTPEKKTVSSDKGRTNNNRRRRQQRQTKNQSQQQTMVVTTTTTTTTMMMTKTTTRTHTHTLSLRHNNR